MLAADALIYRIGDFELDSARFELRNAGEPMAIEPQVLSLLLLLAANPDRLVGKDELIEKIWNNRIVSDAAIASRIKSARHALGDDGKQQKYIRTVHGRGFRFVGDVRFARRATPDMQEVTEREPTILAQDPVPDRPSIAILPFISIGEDRTYGFLADALADEVIADLARLRWLFVIARGSSFRFRGVQTDCRQVGDILGVRYCLTGNMRFSATGVSVAAELVETATGRVVWADVIADSIDHMQEMRREVAARIVSALEIRIPSHEADRFRSMVTGKLDAWSAYHIGLDHMFRFNRADNQYASRMFEHALKADPDFARANAGLSFTHFQNAFLNYLPDREPEALAARELAERALQLDRLDPFCHLNMGRSLWLHGDLQGSIDWLEQASVLSPSYAQGIYSMAWAKTLSGEAAAGEQGARMALQLSPLDPLRYAMIATCSLSRLIMGDYQQAAVLAERAARTPGAHVFIAVIAALGTRLAGEDERAAHWIDVARSSRAGLSSADFFASFPFAPTAARETIERELSGLGL